MNPILLVGQFQECRSCLVSEKARVKENQQYDPIQQKKGQEEGIEEKQIFSVLNINSQEKKDFIQEKGNIFKLQNIGQQETLAENFEGSQNFNLSKIQYQSQDYNQQENKDLKQFLFQYNNSKGNDYEQFYSRQKFKYQQDRTFSKPRAQSFFKNSEVPLFPNPQCLGCIQFFYSRIPYNFERASQKFIILSSKQSQNIQTHLRNLISSQQQTFMFLTEYDSNLGQKYVKGFSLEYNIKQFLKVLVQKIKHLSYEKGQLYFSLTNFQIRLLPIFKDFVLNINSQQQIKNVYQQRFVVRIQFIPEKNNLSCQRTKTNKLEDYRSNNCTYEQIKSNAESEDIKKQKYNNHFPLKCQKPVKMSFLPSPDVNTIEILQQISRSKENTFKYKKVTLIQLLLNTRKNLITLIENKFQKQKIKHNIFEPFTQVRANCINTKKIWVISHQCDHNIIKTLLKQFNQLGDLKIHKPTKNLIVHDEDFFNCDIFNNFTKIYDNLTSSPYKVFNQKHKMKFLLNLQPIYLLFQQCQLAILAICLLLDLNSKKVSFIKSNSSKANENVIHLKQGGKFCTKLLKNGN